MDATEQSATLFVLWRSEIYQSVHTAGEVCVLKRVKHSTCETDSCIAGTGCLDSEAGILKNVILLFSVFLLCF